jgi:hypothetical protein
MLYFSMSYDINSIGLGRFFALSTCNYLNAKSLFMQQRPSATKMIEIPQRKGQKAGEWLFNCRGL